LDAVFGGPAASGLPPTRLDSLVYQSGLNFTIYGDEGVDDKPPLDDFSYIDSGITSGQLTTGHRDGSLPSAWGYPVAGKP
jgi:hypothetical protein